MNAVKHWSHKSLFVKVFYSGYLSKRWLCLFQNVLKNFDYIVVTVGSGGSASGIAFGNYLTGSKLKNAFICRGKPGHQRRTQVNKCWTRKDCILQNWIIYLQVTGTDILILENEIPCLSKKLFTLYNVWKYGSSIFVQSEILYNTVRYHFHEKSKNYLHEHVNSIDQCSTVVVA